MLRFKTFNCRIGDLVNARQLNQQQAVQKFIDSEVIRRMEPFVPLRDGTLKSAAIAQTNIGSGDIRQKTPYARRWYYTQANFNEAPRRGCKWFERMKAQQKDSILRGAAQIARSKAK